MYRITVGLDLPSAYDESIRTFLSKTIDSIRTGFKWREVGAGVVMLSYYELPTPSHQESVTAQETLLEHIKLTASKETAAPVEFLLEMIQQSKESPYPLARDIIIFSTKAPASASLEDLNRLEAAWSSKDSKGKRLLIVAPDGQAVDYIAGNFDKCLYYNSTITDYMDEDVEEVANAVVLPADDDELEDESPGVGVRRDQQGYRISKPFTADQIQMFSELQGDLQGMDGELRFGIGEPFPELRAALGPEVWEVVLIYVSGKLLDSATNQATDKLIKYIIKTCGEWFKKQDPKTAESLPKRYVICNEDGQEIRSFTVIQGGANDDET